ncbi:trypsin-like peptidase domain-containing protein [Streptomyces sp. BPTC-684]|uniref:trypsin-like peptidase domain-containing protein n=1 Tax=Streptomyces sp. BPTC-684 TaxID=3043734 RepID=UPI0024B1B4E8|nr:trypsin-like peptidase domain-containing protein [Streptomyces sp. BPTC-684]WHM37666.1 trypsin-like peptidase domain-containing protein [Streptomyces sp. BPTC-684]
MSTENEGTAVPAVPPAPSSAPPAPPAPPVTSQEAAAPSPATEPAATHATPEPAAAPETASVQGSTSVQAPTSVQETAPAQESAHQAHEPVTAQLPGPVPAEPYGGAPATHAQGPAGGWPTPPPALPAYGGGGGGPVWGAPVPEPQGPRRRGGLVAAVLAAALVAGGVGGAIGYWAADREDGSGGSTTVSASDTPKDFKRDPGTVAAVAAKALPSVVTIQAEGSDGEGGTGTGFVYDREGHIVTNNHVVASAANSGKLSATFSNGKKYDAEVVGRAQGYDVAVIKLKNAPSNLVPLALGNSDQVAVGDSTIAIGAPFGLSNTVTTGIISAKNRPVASSDGANSRASYMSALQTDASINPGNSGGPLLDSRGAVIGINSAIQSAGSGGFGQSQAGSIGLGFAIPVNQAKNVAEQLIKTGKPVYPVIGATVTMEEKGQGAKISAQASGGTPAVVSGGPADKVGLKPGDVITKFGDTVIDSGPTLISEIWTHKPGDQVQLTYKRDGKESTVTVTLGERTGDS